MAKRPRRFPADRRAVFRRGVSLKRRIYPWRSGNHFELLIDGPQFFPRMRASIEQALERIDFELYLLEAGGCAEQLVGALEAAVARGGYVLREAAGGKPAVVLIATGSEVALAVQAQETLAGEGIAARVVSMPSTTVFDRQDAAWRAAVLPAGVPRVAVEAGSTDFWRKYVGAADDARGAVVGIDRFGESAPAAQLFDYFGITADAVVRAARDVVRAMA